jgi:hypothetical protein
MKTIWRFPIQFDVENSDEIFKVTMPKNAKFMFVDIKEGRFLSMWMEVDTKESSEIRSFRLFATGESLDEYYEYLRYCGSFIFQNSGLVFHLYEVLSEICV